LEVSGRGDGVPWMWSAGCREAAPSHRRAKRMWRRRMC
jgi:hypothetical protein